MSVTKVSSAMQDLTDDYAFTGTVTGAGKVVQVVNTQTGAYATGTTQLPSDDTIPQISEGVEWSALERTITPTSASNKLLIIVNIWLSSSIANANISTALFKSGTTSALSSGFHFMGSVGRIHNTTIIHYEAAGSTSELTFQVRSGTDAASTVRLNGDANREHGGAMESSVTVWEIAV